VVPEYPGDDDLEPPRALHAWTLPDLAEAGTIALDERWRGPRAFGARAGDGLLTMERDEGRNDRTRIVRWRVAAG
jgi:hypothetical protein